MCHLLHQARESAWYTVCEMHSVRERERERERNRDGNYVTTIALK